MVPEAVFTTDRSGTTRRAAVVLGLGLLLPFGGGRDAAAQDHAGQYEQREGSFHALNATSGDLLWTPTLGAMIASGQISYQVDDTQFVAVASGHSLFIFALRN